jgi:ubiquinone/menaquinone biosynthesis C-methylase UbiE
LQIVKETGGSVLATDFAPKMIECVKEAAKNSALTNVEARVEDGQDLHIPDLEFDYAFSIFGLVSLFSFC